MNDKEQPKLDYYPLLNVKYHKDFQHIIRLCQWLIVVVIIDIAYAIYSLCRLLSAPWVGQINLATGKFGYLNNYPKQGYLSFYC